MKKMLKYLAPVFLIGLFMALTGCTGDTNTTSVTNPNPNPFNPKGTVSGVLRDAVTNVAIVGAKVQIMDRVATTDSSGIFTISNVPALQAVGNEPANGAPQAYTVVIDMTTPNNAIKAYNDVATNTVKKAYYPAMSYADALPYYTSLGDSTDAARASANATNHDTPVDGFVCNITPFVGKLNANIKMQVVNSSLAAQSGATVYLFYASAGTAVQPGTGTGTTAGTSTVAADGGAPGMLIATATTDSNGYATFSNIEAKRRFYVKAVLGANQGWWTTFAAAGGAATPTAQGAGTAITAPSDGLTDIYGINQSGSTSTDALSVTGGVAGAVTGTYFSSPLVIGTADGIAPFVLASGNSPANLSDVAIPASGNFDFKFTFSEPIRATQYATNLTRETSLVDGLYNDVTVNYLGPKVGNIPHTIAWDSTMTVLTVSIPVTSMTAASRYTVSIANATNSATKVRSASNQLCDANNNLFVAGSPRTTISITTAGGFNVAAPTLTKDTTSPYTVNWTPVTNAFGYRVYVEATAGTGFYQVRQVNAAVGAGQPTAAQLNDYQVTSPTTFSLTLLKSAGPYAIGDLVAIGTNAAGNAYNVMANGFAGGKSYNVYAVAVSSNGSESERSSVVAVSETKPSAPTGLARRGTTAATQYMIDWTAVTGATQYTVWVQTLQNGAALAGYVPVATVIDPTYSLAGAPATGTMGSPGYVPAGLPFAGTGTGVNGYALGAKLSYNVAVSTTSPTNTLTSDLSSAVLIDDKLASTLTILGGTAVAAPSPVLGTSVIAGGSPVTAVQSGIGALSGLSGNAQSAVTSAATITVPEQLSYTSAIAAANWTITNLSASGFATGRPGAAVAPVTALIDVVPTITSLAYNRAAAGGTVTFTLNYASPGTNGQAWYGAAGTLVLQTSAQDLNGNALANNSNGTGNNAGLILN